VALQLYDDVVARVINTVGRQPQVLFVLGNAATQARDDR